MTRSPHASSPDPTGAGNPAAPDEVPAETGIGRVMIGLLVAVTLGLGLRLGYAVSLGTDVGEWEADGFVTVWEGRPWGALNRVRAPGLPILLTQLRDLVTLPDVFAVRLASLALSVLGLVAAILAASAVASLTGLSRRSGLRAGAWMAAIWAVHPTLIAASVSPTPELITGSAACLLLAALAWLRRAPGVVSWSGACLAGGVFVVAGGLVAGGALAMGVLVYLLPVPRVTRALGALAGLGLALGAGFVAQAGPDSARPWLPETAWAYSVSALAEAPAPHPNDVPTQPDRRARQALDRALDGVAAAEVLELGHAWVARFVFDLMGPRRLEAIGRAALLPDDDAGRPRGLVAVGFFDVFLRGGLLLFVLTVLGLVGGGAPSCWPRAGCVAGALAWLGLLVAGAVGPLALAPFDLVLLAMAGAGVAGTDPRRVWTRRIAFAVGGGLLCTLLLTAGFRDERLDPWIDLASQRNREGRTLVGLLADGGPRSGVDTLRVANLLMTTGAPFLRMPDAGYEHALAATRELADTADLGPAIELLVRAQVECGRFTEAARLAEEYHTSVGDLDRRSMLLLDWVQGEQRKTENLPIRR